MIGKRLAKRLRSQQTPLEIAKDKFIDAFCAQYNVTQQLNKKTKIILFRGATGHSVELTQESARNFTYLLAVWHKHGLINKE